MASCRITQGRRNEIREKTRAIPRVEGPALQAHVKRLLDDVRNTYSMYENKTTDGAKKAAEEIMAEFTERYKDNPELMPSYITLDNIIYLLSRSDLRIRGCTLDENADTDLNDNEKRAVSNLFLYDSYGENEGIIQHVKQRTNEDLFNVLFIDRRPYSDSWMIASESELGSRYKNVNTNDDINRRLRAYEEHLFYKIYDYLLNDPSVKLTDEEREFLENNDYLYDGDTYSGLLETLEWQNLMSTYILTDTALSRMVHLFDSSNYGDMFFEAYNALTILNNFDNYLLMQLPGLIHIQVNTVGKRGENYKYALTENTSNVRSSFRTTEDINVAAETSNITKMVINTTPLFSWRTESAIDGMYLKFDDWTAIISRVSDLLNQGAIYDVKFDATKFWFSLETRDVIDKWEYEYLYQVIEDMPSDPQTLLPVIFDILTDKGFASAHPEVYGDFDANLMNKLYTIHRKMFNDTDSLRRIQDPHGTNNYYNYIVESAGTIHKSRHLQYARNAQGFTTALELRDATILNKFRSFENRINGQNNNSFFKSWAENAQELGIVKALYGSVQNLVEFSGMEHLPDALRTSIITDKVGVIRLRIEIPNTNIKLTVDNNGRVEFDDNTNVLEPNLSVEELNSCKQYIKKVLGLDLVHNSSLYQSLKEKNESSLLGRFLQMSARVVYNKFLQNTIMDNLNMPARNILNAIDSKHSNGYSITAGKISLLHPNDFPFAHEVAEAMAALDGLTTASTVLDGSGNANSTYTLNRLYDSFKHQWRVLRRNSPASHFTLINQHGIVSGMVNMKEFYDVYDGTKATVDMTAKELYTASFLYDYIVGRLAVENDKGGKVLVGNGKVLIMPAVVSDKSLSGKLIIDLNTVPDPSNGNKKLIDYTRDEIIDLAAKELGLYYMKMRLSVDAELNKLTPLFRLFMNDITAPEVSNLEAFNQYITSHLRGTPAEVMDSLIRLYNEQNPNEPVILIDLTHFVNKGGKLQRNLVIDGLIERYSNKENYMQFYSSKERELITHLLDNDVRFDLSDTTKGYVKYLTEGAFKDWVSWSGNLVLCKVILADGRIIDISSRTDLRNLEDEVNKGQTIKRDWRAILTDPAILVQIHPEIARHNALDHFISEEFLNSTVGSFTNHPYKGGTLEEWEASLRDAQNKRNQSLSAPVMSATLNSLSGISRLYKIAVIDELYDRKGTVNGNTYDINGADGATFVNPFTVLLENNSLGGNSSAVNKKPFAAAYSRKTGTGIIVKTASFGMTNANIRESILLLRMMQKMTDIAWRDLDGNLYNADISTAAIHSYKPMYFTRDDKYYRINSIIKDTEDSEPGSYRVNLQEVDECGVEIMDENGVHLLPTSESWTNVNSNYKLWLLFGGTESMSLVDGRLEHSNSSVENVVLAMNAVIIPLNENGEITTQSDGYLPLKHSDINWLCGKGAIKQGAANVNSRARWHDDTSLNWFTMEMENFGILLDKEHEVDYDDVAGPTQAFTSSALRLYTATMCKNLYNALGSLSHLNTESHLNVIRELVGNPDDATFILQFREILQSSMIEKLSLSDGSYNNFASAVVRGIMQRMRTNGTSTDLPYSDNNLFNKITLEINTYFTEKGIKVRLPGVLAVLVPSYGIMLLYGEKKLSHTSPAELQALQLMHESNPVYARSEEGTEIGNISNIKLDRTYKVQYTNELNDTSIYVDIHEYQRLKLAVREGRILKITEKVWDDETQSPVGRDLASYNARFSDTEGRQFQLYDLDSIQALFELEDIVTQKVDDTDYIGLNAKLNNLQEFITKYPGVVNGIEYGRYHIDPEIRSRIQQITNIIELGRSLNNISSAEEVSKLYTILYGQPLTDNLNALTDSQVTEVKNNLRKALGEAYNNARRDLATLYNKGKSSANQIHNIGELMPKLSEMVDDYVKQTKKIVHRWKQFDLNNLSLENYERIENFNKLAQRIQDLQQTNPKSPELKNLYEQYSLAVTAKFQLGLKGRLKQILGDGSYIDATNITTPEQFNNVHAYISNWMRSITTVRINGEEHTINRNSVEVSPYEIIAPNRWSEEFGLSVNTDVQEIVTDPMYFVMQLLLRTATKMDNANYSIEFKKNNGRHIYVIDRNQVNTLYLTKVEHPWFLEEEGHRYRTTFDGLIMYEMCNYADMELLEGQQQPQDEIYTDVDGNEVIVTDLARSSQFYVNNLSYSSIRLSRALLSEDKLGLLSSVLNSIETSDNKEAQSISGYATLANRDYGASYEGKEVIYPTETLTSIFDRIEQYNQGENNDSWIYRRGQEMHTSFLRQLELLAARTPGHSMQSFMAMKIVGFTEVNNNMTYVSTMQNLLQGSDFDIDTTTLTFFDVSRNGTIPLWSPYAVTTSLGMFRASEKLPLPTGRTTEINTWTNNANEVIDFFTKYASILDLLISQLRNAEDNDINVTLKEIDTPEKMDLLISFLLEASSIAKPVLDTEVYAPIIQHLNNTYRTEKVYNVFARDLDPARLIEIMDDIFELIQTICDVHNMYLSGDSSLSTNHIGRGLRTKIFNNYLVSNQMHIINDPSNLTLSLTSTDAMVEPYKDIANSTDIARKTKSLGNGNVFAKFILFENALMGKQAVGICAVGSKEIGAHSQYAGDVIRGAVNNPKRLDHIRARKSSSKALQYLDVFSTSNAYLNDPFSTDNITLLKMLALVNNDTDYGLTIGSLVALSADNGKDPVLGKLNANKKLIGMYIYSALMGENFEEVVKILTSDLGQRAAKLLQTDTFNKTPGLSNAYELKGYFLETLPYRFLQPYDTNRNPLDPNDSYEESILETYTRIFRGAYKEYLTPYEQLLMQRAETSERESDWYNRIIKSIIEKPDEARLGKLALSLGAMKDVSGKELKRNVLKKVRDAINKEKIKSYLTLKLNLLADMIEDYVTLLDTTYKDENNTKVLRKLLNYAAGAEEARVFGAMLGVNLKIKTNMIDFLRLVDNFESAIVNRKHVLGEKSSETDMIDLVLFAFNEEYRNEKIAAYEKIKHSINILDAATSNPHYMAYIESLAGALKSHSQSFRFNSIRTILRELRVQLGLTNTQKLVSGINRYLNDYLCNEWLSNSEAPLSITIPAGNKIFDSNSPNSDRLAYTYRDTKVALGTDWGNASFRLFMEQVIIPLLKEMYPNNEFIQGLTPVSINRTILGNPINVYSLDINMMPRNDVENAILTKYIQSFKSLESEPTFKVYGSDGRVVYENSIQDLFVLYTVIAHGWRMNTSSLMPIIKPLYGTNDLVSSFQHFVARKDIDTQNGISLKYTESMELQLMPYIAESGNPNTSRNPVLKLRNPITGLHELYVLRLEDSSNRRMMEEMEGMFSGEEMEGLYGSEDMEEAFFGEEDRKKPKFNPRIRGNYVMLEHSAPFDYFQTGKARGKSTKGDIIPYHIEESVEVEGGKTQPLNVDFTINHITQGGIDENGRMYVKLNTLTINGESILQLVNRKVMTYSEADELLKVRVIKKDGELQPDTERVVDRIKNKLNPC